MESSTLRAVGYRRVSMRDQVDGFSLDAQENNIRKFAASKGWELREI
jgi:DNA invertase Pin-like site-specific DNA recombinase